MAQHSWLDPSAFALGQGPVGVLLIHGFTGAPTEMRPLGEFLADRGYAVRAPLLPGHGTQASDLNRVRWTQWAQTVQDAFDLLARDTQEVFVAGLSMGAVLALHLAANQPAVRGLLLFAPGLRVLDRRLPLSAVVRYVQPLRPKDELATLDFADREGYNRCWSYEEYPVGGAYQLWRLQCAVRGELAKVHQPMIIFQGYLDRAVRRDSPQVILDRVSSTDKRMVWLERSGHALTVDAEREEVFAACLAWLQAHQAVAVATKAE